jgi:diguanylate cyclase (GGDEF)-like protein/excisionase family DNA binding protein
MERGNVSQRLAPAGEPDWLTLGQAAKYLGVAQSTIRKWSDQGRVPAFYTPGGHRRYRRGDLDAFLERSGPNAAAHSGPVVLIVDDDERLREYVRVNLEMEGYSVREAGNADEGLRVLEESTPDLVLLDVMMPRIDGFEVAQRLRKNPQTANTSIIMLTAKALSADKVTGLQSGADDYIIKPFDPIELLARVKGTLRRAKEMRNLSPLTGLPGNIRIQEEIERQVREEREFAVLYCDLDNFKTYNDQKGFVRGDRLIQATARIIQDAVVEGSGAEGFVGHVGGDDFVAVVIPDGAEEIAKSICGRFDEARAEFYDAEDLDRGFVRMEDRKGVLQDIPLVAISIGIASTSKRQFAHYGEAVAVATEMKSFAKRDGGSSYAVDRRTEV